VERVTEIERREVEPSVLLTLHARLGNRPHWDLGPAAPVRVLGRNNKPVVNGITKGGRYANGAYCPLALEPSAEHIVRARFEYVTWWMAMVELAERCQLSEHEALPPRAAAEPWLTGPEREGRIFRNTEMQIPKRGQRSRVELPPLKSSHGQVRHVSVTTLDDTAC
jgi:hypothetical protein